MGRLVGSVAHDASSARSGEWCPGGRDRQKTASLRDPTNVAMTTIITRFKSRDSLSVRLMTATCAAAVQLLPS